MKAMYTAVATSQGGRDGSVKSSDGLIDMKVALPKEMGGQGGATNPEQLFAAGYAACFHNALLHVARLGKTQVQGSQVTAHVTLGALDQGAFGLAVVLKISTPGLATPVRDKLIAEAHRVCPYSNATRNNIEVKLEPV